MKLATYKDGSRDGQLVVVSRDLSTAHYATGIADTLVVHELPFKVPPIHVDMLWHRRLEHQKQHQWLRHIMQQLPQQRLSAQVT